MMRRRSELVGLKAEHPNEDRANAPAGHKESEKPHRSYGNKGRRHSLMKLFASTPLKNFPPIGIRSAPHEELKNDALNTGSVSCFRTQTLHLTPIRRSMSSMMSKKSEESDSGKTYKKINQYTVISDVGHGLHGKVKLCRNEETGKNVAMKIMNRVPTHVPASRFLVFDAKKKVQTRNDYINIHIYNIKKEIAIMKACNHPNIVKLYEVIDDPYENKVYLFMEYLEKGELNWTSGESEIPIMTHEEARHVFRDLLCGVEYLHYHGIVHRDIKPANILWGDSGNVKIADFSVSSISMPFHDENDEDINTLITNIDRIKKELGKLVGSPAFFAPELCYKEYINGSDFKNLEATGSANLDGSKRYMTTPPGDSERTNPWRDKCTTGTCPLKCFPGSCHSEPTIGRTINGIDVDSTLPIAISSDIWAIGVTLYCLIYGRVPFRGNSRYELFKQIIYAPLEFPDSIEVPESLKYLLTRLLDKCHVRRIPIKKAKLAHWTTEDLPHNKAQEWITCTDPKVICGDGIKTSNEEVKNAFTRSLNKIYNHIFRRFSDAFQTNTKFKSLVNKSK